MRFALLSTSALVVTLTGSAAAQSTHGAPVRTDAPSDRALIANALSAAPPAIAEVATVMGHDGRVLRKGSSDARPTCPRC
jgi:hypothetical protein